jgi:hypothetical protein
VLFFLSRNHSNLNHHSSLVISIEAYPDFLHRKSGLERLFWGRARFVPSCNGTAKDGI